MTLKLFSSSSSSQASRRDLSMLEAKAKKQLKKIILWMQKCVALKLKHPET